MNNEGLIRSRAKRSLLGYLVVWTACVVWFFFLDGSDAMGYSLAVFFLILPLSALVSGYFCGKTVDRRKWLLVPALGLMHSLAHYVTFSLANMMAFHKINAPPFPVRGCPCCRHVLDCWQAQQRHICTAEKANKQHSTGSPSRWNFTSGQKKQ